MNKSTSAKIIGAFTAVVILAGCSSTGDIIEQQKQHTIQIETLGKTVNTLRNELNTQDNYNAETSTAITNLNLKQDELKKQADQTMKVYSVQENDSLYSIAKEKGILLEDLIKLNSQIVNPNNLLIGEIITIK